MSPRSPLEARYGYGAARVPLRPPQRPMRLAPRSLREGLRARRSGDSDPSTLGPTALRALPGLATTALVLSWLFTALLTPLPEESGVRIVPFETPAPLEVAVLEIPEPEALPPEIPEPAPERRIPDAPTPEIERAPEPAPKPVVRPVPQPPPAPRPQITRVAQRLEPPKPEPARRPRAEPPRATPPDPSIDVVAPPQPREPVRIESQRRPVEFAAVPPSAARPTLRAATLPAPTAPAPRTPSARARPGPRPSRPAALPPALDAPGPAPASPVERPGSQRRARRAPAAPAPRRRSGDQKVALALPTPGSSGRPAPAPPAAPAPRAERPAAAAAPASSRAGDPGLPGVALGSLDACVSPRTEDELKQKLIASVGNRIQCESAAGRYHFVQTRNLNAFLMRIERTPRRKPADRCVELTFALDCLSRTEEEG
jgi:hypothetical protein